MFPVIGLLVALAQPTDTISIHDLLVVGPVTVPSLGSLPADPVYDAISHGQWKEPKDGSAIELANGKTLKWVKATANKDGWVENRAMAGGYAWAKVSSPENRVMILEAAGHSMAFINGEPRGGDVYANDYVKLPVLLAKGDNDLLFLVSRGRLKVRLTPASDAPYLETRDVTAPDILKDDLGAAKYIGVLITNPTTKTVKDLRVRAAIGDADVVTALAPIPPLTSVKAPLWLPELKSSPGDKAQLKLSIDDAKTPAITIELGVKSSKELHKRTFISGIDGSVQYFGVQPANPLSGDKADALVLSVHGAGVEGLGQAAAYGQKSWCNIAAATNRRPYGYDWEDWGRTDAMEVLNEAKSLFKPAKDRIYLTGHSMGGHGTWYLGGTYPDQWAAIAPSAGWISFKTYVRGRSENGKESVDQLFDRASNIGDTKLLLPNYKQFGTFVLHGDADDNVPVTEAREMRKLLEPISRDVDWFEQKGAGHWWDANDEPGADAVDYSGIFDFFARHRRRESREVRELDFVTICPGVSAKSYWATIVAQEKSLLPSRVQLRSDVGMRRFSGKTENVARLSLDLSFLESGKPLVINIDDTKLPTVAWPSSPVLNLEKDGGKWKAVTTWSAKDKNPHRYGSFKEAFGQHMLFVYGTSGTSEENDATYAKVRFDSESWWYRGNGYVDVVSDKEFNPDAAKDRSVILYGNADTNGAWAKLLADSPVTVRRNGVTVGTKKLEGADLGCLFLRPKAGSDVAYVGVVGATSPTAMRSLARVPYLSPFFHFPDLTVVGADLTSKGIGGLRGAGYFGIDWSIEKGEFAWK